MVRKLFPILRAWKAGVIALAALPSLAAVILLAVSHGPSFTDLARRVLGVVEGDILDLVRNQPEATTTVGDYVERRVTSGRIETGQEKITEWKATIAAIEKKYGVPAEILVAVWGIESSYGRRMGDHDVVASLATLSKAGYRSDYFSAEHSAALAMMREEGIAASRMVGSWAGAMGQTQLMPSSYIAYAVDYDGDGKKDIWTSVPDSLASTANFLKKRGGWRPGGWGYEVKLPAGFDFAEAWRKESLSLKDWSRLGITRADGKALPRSAEKARFYLPAGGSGPVFLLLRNFDAIKRYNNSDSYALAVAHLADRIGGRGSFVQAWPEESAPLSRAEKRELEMLIAAKGFAPGKPGGHLKQSTRLAIIKFQKNQGLPADGHPSRTLLLRLRNASSAASS